MKKASIALLGKTFLLLLHSSKSLSPSLSVSLSFSSAIEELNLHALSPLRGKLEYKQPGQQPGVVSFSPRRPSAFPLGNEETIAASNNPFLASEKNPPSSANDFVSSILQSPFDDPK